MPYRGVLFVVSLAIGIYAAGGALWGMFAGEYRSLLWHLFVFLYALWVADDNWPGRESN